MHLVFMHKHFIHLHNVHSEHVSAQAGPLTSCWIPADGGAADSAALLDASALRVALALGDARGGLGEPVKPRLSVVDEGAGAWLSSGEAGRPDNRSTWKSTGLTYEAALLTRKATGLAWKASKRRGERRWPEAARLYEAAALSVTGLAAAACLDRISGRAALAWVEDAQEVREEPATKQGARMC